MRLSICQLRGDMHSSRLSHLPAEGGSWVRIGNQLLAITEADDSAAVVRCMEKMAGSVEWTTDRVQREDLWLIIQKGGLFRDTHPDVPVFLDNGRHLIVHLKRSKREALEVSPEPCFGLFNIPWNTEIAVLQQRSAYRSPRNGLIQDLVNGLSKADMEAPVAHLAGFPTRHSTSTHYLAAATWCKGILEDFGYQTQIVDIPVLGSLSQNVIAEKRASGPGPRPMTVVVAHLDSVNSAGGPSAPAPGADDNASGCAALLVLARKLRRWMLIQDVRFLLFGGEEQGLVGSHHYVASLSTADRSRIAAVINMDMIANINSLPPSVLLEGFAGSQGVMNALAAAAATYTSLNVAMSTTPFGSDHVPFINAGIPAVLTIEGSDSSNTLIHTAADSVSELEFDLALEILRMNLAYLVQAVGDTDAPAPSKNWLEPMLQVMMN